MTKRQMDLRSKPSAPIVDEDAAPLCSAPLPVGGSSAILAGERYPVNEDPPPPRPACPRRRRRRRSSSSDSSSDKERKKRKRRRRRRRESSSSSSSLDVGSLVSAAVSRGLQSVNDKLEKLEKSKDDKALGFHGCYDWIMTKKKRNLWFCNGLPKYILI